MGPSSADIDRIVFAAYRLHAEMVRAGDAIAAPFGLSAARWQVCGIVASAGAMTVADLAREIGTARQSVQRIVTELVRDGLLDLADNPSHLRSRLVVLTDAGRRAHDAVVAVWDPIATAISHEMGMTDSDGIARMMRDLAARLHTVAEGPRSAGTSSPHHVERKPS